MSTFLKNLFSVKSNYNSYGKEILFYFMALVASFIVGIFCHGIANALNLTTLIFIFAAFFGVLYLALTILLFLRLLSITDRKKQNN